MESSSPSDLSSKPERATLRGEEAEAYLNAVDKELRVAQLLSRRTPLTWIILVANVTLFLSAWVYGEVVLHRGAGLQTWAMNVGQLSFYTGMKLNAEILQHDQWWRLLSSAFVHMDIAHIAFNGYGLYAIGPVVERFYGRARWTIIYFGSAILSAAASLAFSDAASGGASGALYGLVGAMLVLGFKYRADLPERLSRALTRGMIPWVVFGIGIGFLDMLPMDNAAHIGGLLSGAALTLALQSHLARSFEDALTWRDHAARALAAALTAATLLSAAAWGLEVERCARSAEAYIACYPEREALVTLTQEEFMRRAAP